MGRPILSTSLSQLHPAIVDTIRHSLEEDVGAGDVTSNSIIPPEAQITAHIFAKQEGVIAGLQVAGEVFHQLDKEADYQADVEDGARAEKGQTLATVSGRARSILTAERTALNFLGRMSGIATLTNQFVRAVAGTRAVILDTRKTAPGLRLTDKLAVRLGGGQNHRIGLYDMVLIKDNHIDFAGSIAEAVRLARAGAPGLEVEVEARTLDHVREALALGIERIMLDNMTPVAMAAAVRITAGRAKLEASGNVTLENIRRIAETGVDFISVGALTHSAPVLDVSLEALPPALPNSAGEGKREENGKHDER